MTHLRCKAAIYPHSYSLQLLRLETKGQDTIKSVQPQRKGSELLPLIFPTIYIRFDVQLWVNLWSKDKAEGIKKRPNVMDATNV